jgi:hypothetical protein
MPGIDNSDSDKFKIAVGSVLGTNDAMTITTAGAVSIPGSLSVGSFADAEINALAGLTAVLHWLGYSSIGRLHGLGRNLPDDVDVSAARTTRWGSGPRQRWLIQR